MQAENLELKSEIENLIVNRGLEKLQQFLSEEVTIWEIIGAVSSDEFTSQLILLTDECGIGGSIVSGQPDKLSDIDILFSVTSLNAVMELLRTHNIEFRNEEYNQEEEIFGRHNAVYTTVGEYKGHPVELYFEEQPLYLQAMPVHINFSIKTYEKYPEIKYFTEYLKKSYDDEENPFGYRKAPTFYSEIIMVNDLGFLPAKTESASRGKKIPKYDGISPGDWIYAKEVYGKDEAIRLFREVGVI